MSALVLFVAAVAGIAALLLFWHLIVLALLCLSAFWLFGQTVGIVVTVLVAACLIGEG